MTETVAAPDAAKPVAHAVPTSSPAGHGRVRSLRPWLPWVLLGIALVVALVVGTRGPSRPPTLDERVVSVANTIKCPVCEGESAANSQSPPAQEIRTIIRQRLQEGQSPNAIRAYFVSDYGPGILLRPRASGIGVLVWALPLVAFILAVGGLFLAFARWRRRSSSPATEDDHALVAGLLEQ